ncbi:MAG: diguanylate cyclase [Synergistota bacterium]|nr:diguanylate cyclase [Synergistota bacterium]
MKILVAEDDVTSLFMLESLLTKWGFQVVSVQDGDEALKILQGEDPPLLAILDWILPGRSGPEICGMLSSRERPDEESSCLGDMAKPYQYIIILTVKGDRESVIAGLESGADDYVTKPFDSHELRLRVMGGKRILDLQEELRNAAIFDALTGIFNRRAVIDRLGREIIRAKREDGTLSVAMLDIDHFKTVNDTYGHVTGDRVLIDSAERITKSVRPYDIVGRVGGEEFLMIFPGLENGDIDAICERVRLSFESKPFKACEEEDEGLSVSVSIGICDLSEEYPDVDSLLAEADKALYRAKNSGRNRVSR